MRYTPIALSLLLLTACGGSDSSDKPEPVPTLQGGYYTGTGTFDNSAVSMRVLVSSNGEIITRFTPSDSEAEFPYGLSQFNATTLTGDFAAVGIGAKYSSAELFYRGVTALTASSEPDDNLSGIVTWGTAVSGDEFSVTRHAISDLDYSLTTVAGDYSRSGTTFSFTLNEDGSFSGYDYSGCDISGQLSKADSNIFEMSYQQDVDTCDTSFEYSGLVYFAQDSQGDFLQFYLMHAEGYYDFNYLYKQAATTSAQSIDTHFSDLQIKEAHYSAK